MAFYATGAISMQIQYDVTHFIWLVEGKFERYAVLFVSHEALSVNRRHEELLIICKTGWPDEEETHLLSKVLGLVMLDNIRLRGGILKVLRVVGPAMSAGKHSQLLSCIYSSILSNSFLSN